MGKRRSTPAILKWQAVALRRSLHISPSTPHEDLFTHVGAWAKWLDGPASIAAETTDARRAQFKDAVIGLCLLCQFVHHGGRLK